MWKRGFHAAGLACAVLVSGAAQEGHPLTGTWTGDWGPTVSERTHVTLVMYWDGENVTGIINPGPNSTAIDGIWLDVTDWTVRLEASARDSVGAARRIAAEGRLENIGSYHRTLTGVWRQGETVGDFRLTRD